MSPTDRPAPPRDLLAEADVRSAARALMRTPLLHADNQTDDLALVRRHQDELVRLFADGLGYRLLVEPGLARLYKPGLGNDASRAFLRRNGTAFTPHRYAMLSLVLAALMRARRQVMVDELVAAVRSAAVDAGVDADLDSIHGRRALHSALVALVDLGVLSERDGDLEHWAESDTQSLLDVHRDRLAVLVSAPLGACNGPDDALAVAAVPSSAGGARVAIRRLLAEQSVLSIDELSEEQLGWWRRNREREREWFRRAFGLELEIRVEGALAIDSSDDLTDLPFPASGSAKHFALLLLAALVDELRSGENRVAEGSVWGHIATSTVQQAADRIFSRWKAGLRKEHRENPSAVYAEALGILAAIGLVQTDEGGVQVHAASARYAPRPELVNSAGPSGEQSLFGEDA